MTGENSRSETTWLAWAGWRMRVPLEWRPEKIEGGRQRGVMLVGDGDRAVAQVKWTAVEPGRFDPGQWAARRLKRDLPARGASAAGPGPPGFEGLGWVEPGGDREDERTLWYGYCPRAGLIVEVVLGGKAGGDVRRAIRSLEASAVGEPVRWAVFGAGFVSPPGFDVQARRFQPGHMCMLFEAKGGQRLLVRQIYPAQMALARKDIVAWMRSAVFPERRRFHPAGEPEPWSVESFGRRLEGLIRLGRKRLPAPLGWVLPRHTVAAGVVDPDLDRLLLAEHDSPAPQDDSTVADTLAGMNWPHWQAERER